MLGNSEMENCIFNFISRILIDASKVKAEAEKRFSFYSPPTPTPASHGESAYCSATLYYDIYVWIGLNGMLVRSLRWDHEMTWAKARIYSIAKSSQASETRMENYLI